MAYLSKIFILTSLVAVVSLPLMADSRPNPGTSLAARLKLEGETMDCCGSLFELQACIAEVITFFLNCETELGPNCCEAIRIIEHESWPALLGSLGYTAEEGDILRAYCDSAAGGLPASPPPPAPPSFDQHTNLVP